MLASILGFAIGFAIFIWVLRKNPKIPSVQTEEELRNLGYSAKEAKREARAQRGEHRASIRATTDGIKSASQAARTVKRLGKWFK